MTTETTDQDLPDDISDMTIEYTSASILDCTHDKDTVYLPFNTADYGEYNGRIQECDVCKGKFKQGEMKELGRGSPFMSGEGRIYSEGLFVCKDCWFTPGGYGDIGNWEA